MYYSYYPPYLCHHGIKGQKWGLRRYQNPDGTLTDAGRKRYGFFGKHALKQIQNKNKKEIKEYRNKFEQINKNMRFNAKGALTRRLRNQAIITAGITATVMSGAPLGVAAGTFVALYAQRAVRSIAVTGAFKAIDVFVKRSSTKTLNAIDDYLQYNKKRRSS